MYAPTSSCCRFRVGTVEQHGLLGAHRREIMPVLIRVEVDEDVLVRPVRVHHVGNL